MQNKATMLYRYGGNDPALEEVIADGSFRFRKDNVLMN